MPTHRYGVPLVGDNNAFMYKKKTKFLLNPTNQLQSYNESNHVGCPVGAVLLAWDPITCGVEFVVIVVARCLLVPAKDEDLSLLRGLCLLACAELLHPASVAAAAGMFLCVFLCVLLCEMGIQIILNIV